MNAQDDAFTAGVERLNALLGWWGIPIASGNGAIDSQMKRFQQFSSDLQKMCSDAYSGQMDALFSSNDRLIRSLQDLSRSRQPQEVMAAQSDILATFLETASSYAKRWAELTQKLQECCATIARDAAEDIRPQTEEKVSPTGVAKPEEKPLQTVVKQTRRQVAQA